MSKIPGGYSFAYSNRDRNINQKKGDTVDKKNLEYDLEKLKLIPIDDVLDYYDVDVVRSTINSGRVSYKCPNNHTNKKTEARLVVYKKENICKCHNCDEVKGDPIAIAKFFNKGDFKEACKELTEAFNIGKKESNFLPRAKRKRMHQRKELPKIDYWRFDRDKKYEQVDITKYFEKYKDMSQEHKLILVYTAIYRFSLKTNQEEKLYYYKSRDITDSYYLQYIGWLSPDDIKKLCVALEKYFPLDDLVRFNIYGDADAKKPFQWKYFTKNGFSIVPSSRLYSDTVNGLTLRQTDFDAKGPKEFNVVCNHISAALPFGINPMMLRNKRVPKFITEGHIDGLSIDRLITSFTGVNNYQDEWLGLFQGHDMIIAYDRGKAAYDAIYGLNNRDGLMKKLYLAGAKSVKVLNWDESLGDDLNDLLKNGNIDKVVL